MLFKDLITFVESFTVMNRIWPFPDSVELPIIGMLHLRALPGSPNYDSLEEVIDSATQDLKVLQEGGVDAFMVENLGDMPYFRGKVPSLTVASMARVISELSKDTALPFGVNVLRNDSISALSLAYCFGGSFIRANVLTEAYVTDQGIIQGNADQLLRFRRSIGADRIAIFADVHSKHAYPLSGRSLADSVADTVERGLADAIVITGERTGIAPTLSDIKAAKAYSRVIIGSGLTASNAHKLLVNADAAIVGTYFKAGDLRNPLDLSRVKRLMEEVKKVRKSLR